MSFLNSLSGFGQGAIQGYGQMQGIKAKAMELQQQQLMLDQQKKELAGQFAAFNNMQQGNTQFAPPSGGVGPASAVTPPQGPAGLSAVGPQQLPMAQPMPPGQASAPAPQQPPMTGPGMPAPASGAPAGSPGPSPSPVSTSAQLDPNDPQAPIKLVMGVAQEIKARNPNIDPQTLFYATQNVIKMSSGIAPALRQQAILLGDQIRAQTSRANTQDRVGATERGQDVRAETAAESDATRRRGQDIGLQRTQIMAKSAMDRVQYVQNQLNSRFATGQGSKAQQAAVNDRMKSVTARLTAATRQLATLKDAAGTPFPDTDPRVQKVKAEIDAANGDLDRIATVAQIQPQSGGETAPANDDTASPSPAPKPKAANTKPFTPPSGARPTASDGKGNTVEWDGRAWVPVKKSAAK